MKGIGDMIKQAQILQQKMIKRQNEFEAVFDRGSIEKIADDGVRMDAAAIQKANAKQKIRC